MRKAYLLILVIGAIIIGMVIGAISVSFQVSKRDILHNYLYSEFSFNEFVGILLACIALIMTIFGVFLAVLAIYGFSALQERVILTSSEVASATVLKSLAEGGNLYQLAERSIKQMMYRGVGLAESSGAFDPLENNEVIDDQIDGKNSRKSERNR
jgi:hypothetical protein